MKNTLLLIALLLTALPLPAQSIYQIFRGTRVVNGHSVQTLNEGEMELIIGHRFGRLNGGFYELFGLDQASIRLGLDYGIKPWINIGLGRSSLGKEFDGFVKLRFFPQGQDGSGMPFALTGFSSTAYSSLKEADPQKPLAIQNRLAFTHQLLLARKFSDRLSLQVMPTLVHYNLVATAAESNDKISIGAAGKYQLSKNWALTAEYYYNLPRFFVNGEKNVFSVGVDLNTGSHVFQLHFTNAAGMIEKQFIGETTGDWLKGDIHFGFNMVRTFKLKGRRY